MVALCAGYLVAQDQTVTNSNSTPLPGSGHDYINLLSETVNPANGSLSLRLAFPVPPGRGVSLPFVVSYDSNGVHTLTPIPKNIRWLSFYNFLAQGGWSYSMPLLSNHLKTAPSPNFPTETCHYNVDWTFDDPLGTRHALALAWIYNSGLCNGVANYQLTGGDDVVSAALASQASKVPVKVASPDGTVYSFSNDCAHTNNNDSSSCVSLPDTVEDRNGNEETISDLSMSGGATGAFKVVDTMGRTAISSTGFGTSGNTIVLSGLGQPFTITWGTAISSFNVGSSQIIPDTYCATFPADSETQAVITAITLPNGQKFQFSYDTTWGLLNKIVYPSGAYVSYVWGEDPLDASVEFTDSNGNLGCEFRYGKPVVLHRYVSVNGITNTERQDFSYSTSWGSGMDWTSKSTKVTTYDLVRNTQFDTVYSYTYVPGPVPPYDLIVLFDNQLPVENTITYKAVGGAVLRTVAKTWFDQFEMASQTTTLDNGKSSKVTYQYDPGAQVRERDEYDFGQTTPSRKTIITHQSIAATPIYPSGPSIFDLPQSIKVEDGNNNVVSRTDYYYDQGSVAAVLGDTSLTNHDAANYSSASAAPRGNVTTTSKWVNSGGSTVTTKTGYDETGQVVSTMDPENNVTQYGYADNFSGGGPAGVITNGYLTSITYPSTNSPNASSHQESFAYFYGLGKLAQETDQNQHTRSYSYSDPLGRLTGVTEFDGSSETISYNDAPGALSREIQHSMDSSHSTDVIDTFDGIGRGLSHISANGESSPYDRTDSQYDGLGLLEFHSYPCQVGSTSSACPGTGDSFNYDSLGRQTKVTHSDGTALTIQYTGAASENTDEGNGSAKGSVQRIYQHDGLGRLTSVCEVTTQPLIGTDSSPVACSQDIGGTGFLTTYGYDLVDNLKSVAEGSSQSRSFTYDWLSRLTSAVNPESGQSNYTYLDTGGAPCSGNPSVPCTRTDARGVVTTYSYDQLSRLRKKTYANEAPGMSTPLVTINYDEASAFGTALTNTIGRISSEYTGNTTQTGTIFSYDAAGRIVNHSQCTPQNCGTSLFPVSYSYDGVGDQTEASIEGVALTYSYNRAQRVTTVTSSLWDNNHPATLLSFARYNAFGVPTSLPLGNSVTETRTATTRGFLQNLTAASPNASGATPASGSCTMSGSEQTYTSPATGSTVNATISGTEGGPIYAAPCSCRLKSCCTQYWASGTVSLTVGSLTKTASYGQASTDATIASALATAFQSDSTSPVTAKVNSANTAQIEFTNKLLGPGVEPVSSSSHSYNAGGYFPNPSFSGTFSAWQPGYNSITFYDSGTVSITINSSDTKTVSYNGGDTSQTVASNLAAAFSGDSLVSATLSGSTINFVSATKGSATNYALSSTSATNDPSHFSHPSFAPSDSGANLTGGLDATLYSLAMTYWGDADVKTANDSVNGNWVYGYDDFNRLLNSSLNSGQQTFTYDYDRYGNRWHQNAPQGGPAPQFSFTNGKNQIDSFTYDANGNLLGDGNHTYSYDAENRIVAVDPNLTPATAVYVYDANGNRVRKTTPSTALDYVNDLSGRTVAEINNAGAWNRLEVFVSGRHLATYANGSGGTILFDHVDWLGTERARSNMTPALAESLTGLPFGDGATAGGSSPVYFTGKERDSETGLDNFGARYGGSSMGRFMSPDPLGGKLIDPQTLNKYSYVRDNPINFTDPTGLYICADSTKDHNCTSDQDKKFEAARQSDLARGGDAARAAAAYGDPNKDNGVKVGFADLSKESERGVTTSMLGADDKGTLRANSNVVIDSRASGDKLEAVVGHEGSHVADAQDLVKSIISDKLGNFTVGQDITQYQSEQRAYHVSDSILRSGNQTEKYNCGLSVCVLGVGLKNPGEVTAEVDRILQNNYKSSINQQPLTPANQGGAVVPH